MLRGCQKRIYYIRDPRSTLFAEAYFILKNDPVSPPAEKELAAEARRIVENFDHPRHRCLKEPNIVPPGQKIGAFIVGAASSSALIGGIALLLVFA